MKQSGRGWAQTRLEAVSATVAREDLIYKTGSESWCEGEMSWDLENRIGLAHIQGSENISLELPQLPKPWKPLATLYYVP